jgi:ribosomal protein S18 acetylase RimI-like enzyme
MNAVALIYRGADIPVLFATGKTEELQVALSDLQEPELYLSVRENVMLILPDRYRLQEPIPMYRMIARNNGDADLPMDLHICRLGAEDAGAVEEVFRDGGKAGEAPDFYQPWMVPEGVFFGIRVKESLVAVAGTHLVALQEEVAAVGNVYTRQDSRGRGYGIAVTRAVTRELKRMGIRTIGLNVRRSNRAAIRVYERCGYEIYCEFVEGKMYSKVNPY